MACGLSRAAFAQAAIGAYARQGTPIQRILTNNGSGYRSKAFRRVLAEHGIRHIRTRPYPPRTNGKAEPFIGILQREWAYGLISPSSAHRARALPGWLRWYNKHRPHGGINGHRPQSRVTHAGGYLLGRRGWITVENRAYWRYPLEVEAVSAADSYLVSRG